MDRQNTVTIDLTAEAGASLPYLCLIFPARSGLLPQLASIQTPCVLGRSEGVGVSVVLEDVRVSRRHAEVIPDGNGEWRIRDLGSKNGLFIDGARVDSAPLTDGSRIRIGNSILLFREIAVDAPPAMPRGLPFFGTSVALRRVEEACRRAAPTSAAMLLRGATGSGKEVFARYVHQVSGRSGPFVPVNCAAVSDALFESAFFGHRKGAFTGASSDFEGFARSAEHGTLFLDEVAEMGPEIQAKLLRFLDSGEVTPVGSTSARSVDVRILAATNQDLEARMADGRFRPDLFARLTGRQILIPSLVDRPEDVLDIALHLLVDGISPDAAEALILHDWPFNVRELQSVLDAARVDAPAGAPLPLAALPTALRGLVAGRGIALDTPSTSAARKFVEPAGAPTVASDEGADGSPPSREELEILVSQCGGNVSEVARRLGKERRQIYRWLHRFGLMERS